MPGATRLSRRTVLRGLGTAVALWLEAMAPAAGITGGASAAAAPSASRFSTCPTCAHASLDAFERRCGIRPAVHPRTARSLQGRLARSHRPGARQRRRTRRRRRRPRPLARLFLTGVHPLKSDSNLRAGSLGRPSRRATDRQVHQVPLARTGMRPRHAVGQLRLGLQFRLFVKYLLAIADDADGQGGQSPTRFRPPLHWPGSRGNRLPAGETRTLSAQHPRLRRRRCQVVDGTSRHKRSPQGRRISRCRPRIGNPRRARREIQHGRAAISASRPAYRKIIRSTFV